MRIHFFGFLEDPRSWYLETVLILRQGQRFWKLFTLLDIIRTFGSSSHSWILFLLMILGMYEVDIFLIFYNDGCGQATLYFH